MVSSCGLLSVAVLGNSSCPQPWHGREILCVSASDPSFIPRGLELIRHNDGVSRHRRDEEPVTSDSRPLLSVELRDLVMGEPNCFQDVFAVQVLNATCIFDAQEDSDSGLNRVNERSKDRKDMEVLGRGAGDSEVSTKGVHNGEVLARRASYEHDMVDGRVSCRGNSERLSNSQGMIGHEVPHVFHIPSRNPIFSGLPNVGMQRVPTTVGNARPATFIKLSRKQ